MTRLDGLQLIQSNDRDGFLIHSVWLNKHDPCSSVPPDCEMFLASWKHMHPEDHIRHVEWNGRSSLAFLSKHFPSKLAFFESLPTEAQQSDYLRLLLLHHYGGMYVDVDQECHHAFIDLFRGRQDKHILLVQSPLFTEEYTNCLMMSLTQDHPFWLDVIHTVEQTVISVRTGRRGSPGRVRPTSIYPLLVRLSGFFFPTV